MYSIDYDISPARDVLRRLRDFSSAISSEVYAAVHGEIHSRVEDDVLELLAKYPAQDAVHPFSFATEDSRRFYFAAKRLGLFDTQDWDEADGGWERTGTLADSWVVSENTSANTSFISISNNAVDEKGDEYAEAVYGPDPVPGHEATGWGDDQAAALDTILDHVQEGLLDALEEAIRNF